MRKISITLIIFAIAFITGSVSEKEGRLGSANRLIAATRHIRELYNSRVASAGDQFAAVNGIKMHYFVSGSGPVCLLPSPRG